MNYARFSKTVPACVFKALRDTKLDVNVVVQVIPKGTAFPGPSGTTYYSTADACKLTLYLGSSESIFSPVTAVDLKKEPA